jgi:tRNA modification GTPase
LRRAARAVRGEEQAMIESGDTIVAIASATGGGIGIVRLSGPDAHRIGEAIVGARLVPRRARHARFHDADGVAIDDGIALSFRAPASFTGEDVVELQAHGSPAVLRALQARACELGARIARAGEFSERAFHHGKLDLAQAEALADLVAAVDSRAARAARRALDGVFSHQVEALAAQWLGLRVQVEAAIDFADEALDTVSTAALVDTAGLREGSDAIEREGMRRAHAELARADLAIVMVDARDPLAGAAAVADAIATVPQRLWLHNKRDLAGARLPPAGDPALAISVLTGAGLDTVRARLHAFAGAADPGEGAFTARARQVDALRRAGHELDAAIAALSADALDLCAEALRCGHDALGEITGRVVPDALLGHIFSTFCIGK